MKAGDLVKWTQVGEEDLGMVLDMPGHGTYIYWFWDPESSDYFNSDVTRSWVRVLNESR